jgi:hypothetical protein
MSSIDQLIAKRLPNTVSFYPCCSKDILETYEILSKISDLIVYCDTSTSSLKYFESIKVHIPKAIFIHDDAIKTLESLKFIDVFFYRRDSAYEGGSGLYFFGDKYFASVVSKLNSKGALIISDGSNSRGKNWSKMKRKNGFFVYGRFFIKSATQNYLHMKGNGELISIDVHPSNPKSIR